MKFFWLNFQLPYACRHSGVCCTSGWPIPVEKRGVPAIEETIARTAIPLRVEPWLVTSPDLPDDVAGTLALRENGHCVFFEAGRPGCAIHQVKPASCAHFPFVFLFDQRGVRDVATFDDPHRYPTGIEHVLVNGSFVIKDGEHTGSLPGRVLRHQ